MSSRQTWQQEINKKRSDIAPLYLLYGAEEFLLDEALNGIATHVAGDESMSRFRFSGEEPGSLSAAILEAETFPFFSERKVVIVQDCIQLTSKGKTDASLEQLEAYIANPSPFTVMIFAVKADKLDERKKVTKLLKQRSHVYEFPTLKENECKQWVSTRAQMRSLKCTGAAVDRLLLSVGTDLRSLDQELEKLYLYSLNVSGTDPQDLTVIDETIIDQLASRTRQHTLFVFVDDVVRGRIQQALEGLADLQKAKEPAVYLVFMLARQFRIVLQVKTQTQRGYSPPQIAQSLGLHPYVCKIAGEQGSRYQFEQLEAILIKLAELDFKLKSGGVQEGDAVRDFILWLAVSFNENIVSGASYR